MDRLIKQILPMIIAVGAALLTLAGYLVPMPELTAIMVRWAIIIAVFALLLGTMNLLRVHVGRFFRMRRGWPYSLTLLLAAVFSFTITAAGLLSQLVQDFDQWLDPLRRFNEFWFSYILLPLQASAAGLIAFTLALAAFRLMRARQRGTAEAFLFLFSALVVLLGATPLPEPIGERLTGLREIWVNVLALAGMRGFLLGVGLGVLVIGLRIITGMDQPYSDKR